MFKKLLTTLVLAAGLYVSNAAQLVTTGTTAGHLNNNLIDGGARITALTLQNANTSTNITYALLDSSATNGSQISWYGITFDAYTNSITYLTNITYVGTTFTGVTNGMHYTLSNILVRADNPVAAGSNAWAVVFAGTVTSNSTTTLTFPSPGLSVAFGLSLTNSLFADDLTITVTYEPSL